MVKNPPEMQETRVGFLGQEHPLEKEMANHSSILAWRIPWTKKPGGLQSMGSQTFGYNWATNSFICVHVGIYIYVCVCVCVCVCLCVYVW